MYSSNWLWRMKSLKCHLKFRKMSSNFPVLPDGFNVEQLSLVKEKSDKVMKFNKQINKICLDGGGERGQQLHTQINKKVLPRDRLNLLFDEDSQSLELSLQAGLGMPYGDIPGATNLCVIGKVRGKYCMVVANDGTLKGGTVFPISVKKSLRAQQISSMNQLPNIYIVDSGGGFLPLQADFFADQNHGGRVFYTEAVEGALGVPCLSIVCGSCTAGGAYVPMMCDDTVIVNKIGSIYLGGPPLVKAATGENISSEELGGATLHCKISGCTDYFADSEENGFNILRDVVDTLDIEPVKYTVNESLNNLEPLYSQSDLDLLLGAEKMDKHMTYGVISRLVDESRFREFKNMFVDNLIAGYSFINGYRVGIIANFGPITYKDSITGSHFVQNCDQRRIPIIFLQNSGPQEEFWTLENERSSEDSADVLRSRADMMSAVSCSTVPKISINFGGCHGDDNFTMCGPAFNPNFIFSWPGIENTFRNPQNHQTLDNSSATIPQNSNASREKTPNQQNSAKIPDKKSSKIKNPISKFNLPNTSSWYSAFHVLNDGIITPSETRDVLVKCLNIFEQKNRIFTSTRIKHSFRF